MNTIEPEVSVVLTVHNETRWLVRAARSVYMQADGPPRELIIVLDKSADATAKSVVDAITEAPAGLRVQTVTVDGGSLGASRNEGLKFARGKYVQFLDADDMMGCRWLRQAVDVAKRQQDENFVLHHQWSLMFGAAHFFHYHIASDDPSFDARDMVQFNAWSALAFAPKSIFERFPYDPAPVNEDWTFNALTLGNGVRHLCPKDSVFFIRMKLDETSLAKRIQDTKAFLGAMQLFDGDIMQLKPITAPAVEPPSPEVQRQALFAHHQVGEYRLNIQPDAQVRWYPRQRIWNDQRYLRENMRGHRHVVLVQNLVAGGAEKYALDWCKALADAGDPAVIVETGDGPSPWAERAGKVAKVIKWTGAHLEPQERAYALQRALIQAQMESAFICNSELGWVLLRENSEAMAKRVVAASFAMYVIPGQIGFTNAPPFHLDAQRKNLTLLTDNENHAKKMRDYGVTRVEVVRPSCSYRGDSKLRNTGDSKKLKVLWAGRGSYEKCPEVPALVAALMPDVDVHIWGPVQPIAPQPMLPKNLHYHGPFDGFDKIEGQYDCYLITSQTEGMPNTALEAAMADLPIIASDVGDLKLIADRVYPAPAGKEAPKHVQNAVEQIELFRKQNTARQGVDKIVRQWQADFPGHVLRLTGANQ